ncbi:MAG TPA: hypothetical protein VGS16_11455 [Candidatus Dormibacteraeota bacterium]|nr:hypothetical protein [Candidatus Dormibacteraeota bacterium]
MSAASGIALLLALALVPEGNTANRLALIALIALGLATATGWLQLVLQGHPRYPKPASVITSGSRTWLLVAIAVATLLGLVAQTWFRPATTIAGGDLALPTGTAWIGRLFESWTWGGSTLGEPSQLPQALPWAVILGVVHAVGGDPGTAQRIWLTALFVGTGLCALGLLASLRISPIGALAATAVYVLNPYVLTWVNTYDVWIVAMLLLAAIPAALVAAGTGRISVLWGAVLVAASAPLVGYAFFNPPLVGMILAAALAAPLLVAWVEGRAAARRSLRTLLLATPMLLGVSAYWVVPAVLRVSQIAPGQFAGVAGWLWEEPRASIRNAFWLNTHWGWPFPEYFPYAGAYDLPPLSIARFVLPAIAFGALAVASYGHRREQLVRRNRKLRLAVAAASVALFVIVLSTGTNPPGNAIFNPLYGLPFGWLLREPARFLMLAALAYAVLIAVSVDALLDGFMSAQRITVPALRLSIAPLALITAVLLAFPMYTGAFVPDNGPTLASWAISSRPTHVQMPAYWSEMARFADASPIEGAVLVMPSDDWYEMPYTWYYGSDDFIAKLFKRRVLVPSASGYAPASAGLIDAVTLTGRSIVRRDWRQTEVLLKALNTPFILVRRDIEAPYPNHSILSPDDLASALHAAPNIVLLRRIGLLDLYVLRDTVAETESGVGFTMVDTLTPDLRLLPLLPPNTALVSGAPQVGVPNVIEAPGLENWQDQGDKLVWHPPVPAGWTYRLADVESRKVVQLDRAGTLKSGNSDASVAYAPDLANHTLAVSLTGRTAISNGDFAKGRWEPVYDCYQVSPTQAAPYLGAIVLPNSAPGGLPALQLSASFDSACERKALNWHGGSLVLSMMVNHLQGDAPRVCIWQTGPDLCATVPAIKDMTGWSTYRAIVSPDARSTGLTLYLYADALAPGHRTINQYANISIVEVSQLPNLALVADPDPANASSAQLVVSHSSFSADWQGPIGAKHVLVDGMLNGWLIPKGSNTFSAYYTQANAFLAAALVSLATLCVILIIVAWSSASRWVRRNSAES